MNRHASKCLIQCNTNASQTLSLGFAPRTYSCIPLENAVVRLRKQPRNAILSRYFLFGFGLGKALAVARSMGVHLMFSVWFGRGGMSVLGVDVVEDGRLDTRSLLPSCVITKPPTFGI